MGSAIGYALSVPAFKALLVFMSLGAGMAFPYVVLSSSPALLRFLPKPGHWMEHFKKMMAFPVLATAIWILYILEGLTGGEGVLKSMGVLWFMGLGAWVYGTCCQFGFRSGAAKIAAAVVLLCAVGAAGLSYSAARSVPQAQADDSADWEAKVASLRSSGKHVMVDFTAKWCMSCKANEIAALGKESVKRRMAEKNVELIVVDWTNKDPRILKSLEQFGRSGVPLYLIYDRDTSKPPQILPAILTPGIVLDALDKLE